MGKFRLDQIVAIRDDQRNIVCLKCATGKEIDSLLVLEWDSDDVGEQIRSRWIIEIAEAESTENIIVCSRCKKRIDEGPSTSRGPKQENKPPLKTDSFRERGDIGMKKAAGNFWSAFPGVMAIWDRARTIICLRCVTGEEKDNLRSQDIVITEDLVSLNLGKNDLTCPRCSGIIWSGKR